MTMIRVFNCSGVPHQDRFNGVDYNFAVDSTVEIPEGAAVHIFGMGLQDRARTITRLGWAPTSAQFPVAMQRLNGFIMEPVPPDDDFEPPPVVVKTIEKPTQAASDPDMISLKPRTRSVLEKAA